MKPPRPLSEEAPRAPLPSPSRPSADGPGRPRAPRGRPRPPGRAGTQAPGLPFPGRPTARALGTAAAVGSPERPPGAQQHGRGGRGAERAAPGAAGFAELKHGRVGGAAPRGVRWPRAGGGLRAPALGRERPRRRSRLGVGVGARPERGAARQARGAVEALPFLLLLWVSLFSPPPSDFPRHGSPCVVQASSTCFAPFWRSVLSPPGLYSPSYF